ncbi:MAG: sugar ABC transporter ATP-binding protein [Mahellales bacterium]
MTEKTVALRMKGVSKRFPGTLAVDKVDFEVRAGEVHALMGENGAGKSTLMKILAGSYNDYTGEIFIGGKKVRLDSPLAAKSEGVEMVYQELSIAYNRSVQENLFAGDIPGRGIFVDMKRLREKALKSLARVKLDKKIDPSTPMKNISQHEAQLIEMARALNNDPKILVMDEPTSALSNEEVQMLFEIIADLKKQGMAIVYISHHLPEVFEVADRVTVLRDGKRIDTRNIRDVTKEQLVEMMVGQKVADFYKHATFKTDNVVLEVQDLTRYGFVHGVSFKLYKGEILGVAGLAGSGRTELGRCLVGADRVDSGKIILDGKETEIENMEKMLDKGIAYLTEDRKMEGLSLRLTNYQNILSTIIPRLSKLGFYFPSKGGGMVKDLYQKLKIYPPVYHIETGNLSGGNQQKVLLAKWLSSKPKVLILDEPTRGVDVGAKKLIHETMVKLAEEGISIILLSSDLPELVALSDRIVVMRQGHLIGEISKDDYLDENKVLLAANGERGVFSVEY